MDLAKVRQWDVVALDRLEQSLSARIVTCDDVRDRLADIGRLPGWHDDAAVAARERFQVTADQLLDEVAAIGAVRRVTRETSVAVTHLKKELEAIEDLAATNRMTVSDVGDVTDLPGPPADADEAKARETVRDELRAAARAVIFQAEDIDNDAASVLKRAARGETDDRGAVDMDAAAAAGEQQGGLTAPSPPGDASPIENREYWDAMDEPKRRDVIEKHPEWVGNRDGIPADVRHEANVNRIDDERTRLEAERSRLQDELDGNLFGGTFTDDDAAHWYTEQKLKDLDKIESILDENPDGLLLLLDMQSGERGMVAFSVGNPDTADHVAITVPGFNSNIDDSLGGMVGEARVLNNETGIQLMNANRPGESVATIAYLGFEPPQTTGPGNFDTVRGGVDVASTDRATDGATNLAGFLNGLDAASQRDNPHLTALGHSYGSLTTGLALQELGGAPVDDVVFYGSPGVGASSEADLGLGPGHVYAMEADDDRFVPEMGKTDHFGPDPSVIFPNLSVSDGVGPDGVHRDAAHGHSEYARPDAEGNSRMSGYNLAVVVAGLPDLAVR